MQAAALSVETGTYSWNGGGDSVCGSTIGADKVRESLYMYMSVVDH